MTTSSIPVSPGHGASVAGATGARAACTGFHAVGRFGASPPREAPPFRHLHGHHLVEDFGEILAEGIRTSRPSLPPCRFDPDRAHAVMACLKALKR